MPVCTINYKSGPGRRELAMALIKDLPSMLVKSLNEGAGLLLTPTQLVIDIVAYDPASYNMPSLAVVVMIGPGSNNQTYNSRDKVRHLLAMQLVSWLSRHKKLRNEADPVDVEVDLRFMHMCGVNVDAVLGKANDAWGGTHDV